MSGKTKTARGIPVLRLVRIVLLAVALLMLCACKVEVHRKLNEEQANLIWGTLLKRGITAEKTLAGKEGFIIRVEERDLVRALEILRENSLPQENFQNLGKVFSGQGMIASATEEEARLSYAIAQELSDTFSRIDGVLTARVHVVLKKVDEASNTRVPASAAIFVRHTPGSAVSSMPDTMRDLAARSVPGLSPDNISIMMVPVRESISVPLGVSATVMDTWLWPLSVGAALGGLGLLAGFFLGRRGKKTAKDTSTATL